MKVFLSCCFGAFSLLHFALRPALSAEAFFDHRSFSEGGSKGWRPEPRAFTFIFLTTSCTELHGVFTELKGCNFCLMLLLRCNIFCCHLILLYLENKCLQPGIERDGILSIISNINERNIIIVFPECIAH